MTANEYALLLQGLQPTNLAEAVAYIESLTLGLHRAKAIFEGDHGTVPMSHEAYELCFQVLKQGLANAGRDPEAFEEMSEARRDRLFRRYLGRTCYGAILLLQPLVDAGDFVDDQGATLHVVDDPDGEERT